MQSLNKIITTYNTVADDYAAERSDELSKKPLDHLLLKEFARVNAGKGPMADFGCGPGHTTKFLYDSGVKDITGIDIAEAMVQAAGRLFPEIKFETGNLLKLDYPSGHFGAALAFYAIVHFMDDALTSAFNEVCRVLKPGGQFLFSFHVGEETVHFDKAGDKEVDIDLYFFPMDKIIKFVTEAGFTVIDAIKRYPYKDADYPSKRGYIWVEKQ